VCNGGCIENMASASYMVTLRSALIGPAIQHPSAYPSLASNPPFTFPLHPQPTPNRASSSRSAPSKGNSLNIYDVTNIISVNYVPCCWSALCLQAKLLSGAEGSIAALCLGSNLGQETHCYTLKSRIPFIRINWDGETYGYAENLGNRISL
jgi:hypothetical protein